MIQPPEETPGMESGELKLLRACDTCRRKKIRCAGEKPVCSTCQRNQTPCHYSSWVRAKRGRKNLGEGGGTRVEGLQLDSGALMSTFFLQPAATATAPNPLNIPTQSTELPTPSLASPTNTHLPTQPLSMDSSAGIGELLTRIQSLEQYLQNMVIYQNQHQIQGADMGMDVDVNVDFTQGGHMAGASPSVVGLALTPGPDQYSSSLNNNNGARVEQPSNNKRRHLEDADEPDNAVNSTNRTSKLRILEPSTGNPVATSVHKYYEPEVVTSLIELFFKVKHPLLSVFSYDEFLKRFRQDNISDIFLNSILAMACRYSTLPLVMRDPPYQAGDIYHTRARTLAVSAMSVTSLDNIQAFVLMGLYEIGRGKETAWMYIGIATRMAQRMGLNRIDADPNRVYSSREWQQRETKRRVWWLTFITENLTSLAMSRPPSLHPDDCKVNHPSSDQIPREFDTASHDFDLTGTPGGGGVPRNVTTDTSSTTRGGVDSNLTNPASQVSTDLIHDHGQLQHTMPTVNLTNFDVELVLIMSKISSTRSRVLVDPQKWLPNSRALTQELMDWFAKLPPHLQIPPGQRWSKEHVHTQPAFCSYLINLHCLYYTAVIFTNQVDDYLRSQLTLDDKILLESQEFCWNSAAAIAQLMDLLEHLCVQYYSSFFGMCLINAGLVFIDNLTPTPPLPKGQSPDRARVALSVDYLIRVMGVLQNLGRYWYQNTLCIQAFRKSLRQKFPSLPDEEDMTTFLSALHTTALAEFDRRYPSASVGLQNEAQLEYSTPAAPLNSAQAMPQVPGNFSNSNGITAVYLQSLLQGLTQSLPSAVGNDSGSLSSGTTLSLGGSLTQVLKTPQQFTSLSQSFATQTVPSTEFPGSIGGDTRSMDPVVSSSGVHRNMPNHNSMPRPQMHLQGTPVSTQQQILHSAAVGPQMATPAPLFTPASSETRPTEFSDHHISQPFLGSTSFNSNGSVSCAPGLVGPLELPMSFNHPSLLHTNPALTIPTLFQHPQTNTVGNVNQPYGGSHLGAAPPQSPLPNTMGNVNGLMGNNVSLHGLNMAQLYALSEQQQQRLLAARIQQAQSSSLHQLIPNAPTMLRTTADPAPTISNPSLHPSLQQQQQLSGDTNHPSFVNLGLNSPLPPQSMQMLFQSSPMNSALHSQFMESMGAQSQFLPNDMISLGEGYGHMLAQSPLNVNPMCNTNQGTAIVTTTATTPSMPTFAGTVPTGVPQTPMNPLAGVPSMGIQAQQAPGNDTLQMANSASGSPMGSDGTASFPATNLYIPNNIRLLNGLSVNQTSSQP
ncbi:hypothetical protein IWQ61_004580 [Dispira simplex]|nr:hypothetical protein IWQ61_004580 [Dispira simplex]